MPLTFGANEVVTCIQALQRDNFLSSAHPQASLLPQHDGKADRIFVHQCSQGTISLSYISLFAP